MADDQQQRAMPWIAGGVMLAMIIAITVTVISNRSTEQLLPFFGIIIANLGMFARSSFVQARADAKIEEIRGNVNGHLQQHIDGAGDQTT